MKFLIVLISLIYSPVSIAGSTLIINDKVYSITEEKKASCGTVGETDLLAAKTLLSTSLKLARLSMTSKCAVDNNSPHCTEEGLKKFELSVMFGFIRKYPSQYSSPACAELRSDCQTSCNERKVYSGERCLIECSQYEEYNP